MSSTVVHVTGPSRLHFGLLSFGHPGQRQFGGVGVMVKQPGLALRISSADCFVARGPLSHRVSAVVAHMSKILERPSPRCLIEVLSAPPEHVGLGTGTQLALSVVAGLTAWHDEPALTPVVLATLANRAARSGIGSHGFLHGGLLFERGKEAVEGSPNGALLAPLEQRVELPEAWRFLLLRLRSLSGLSGDDERDAFRGLPPVPPATTNRLMQTVRDELLPAARVADFERFGESLYRYGFEAGMCFSARQGGAFAHPKITDLVSSLRSLGIRGVGQSSWGPTVFALLPSESAAIAFQHRMQQDLGDRYALQLAAPDNSGATISRDEV